MGGNFRRQTESHLIIGGFLIVAIVGGAIVWLRYGGIAAIIATSVVGSGVLLLLGLWLALRALEMLAGKD